MEDKQERAALSTLLARAQDAHQQLDGALKSREGFLRETEWNRIGPLEDPLPEYWTRLMANGKRLDGIESQINTAQRCILRLVPDLYNALLVYCARSSEGGEIRESFLPLPLITATADTLLYQPDVAVRNLGVLIALLGQIGRHTRRSSSVIGRRTDYTLVGLKNKVKQFKEARMTFPEMCEKLGNDPRPPGATWKDLSWPKAYKSPKFQKAVKKWLSVASR